MFDFLLPEGILEERPPYWFAIVGSSQFAAPYDGKRRPAAPGAAPRILILEPAGENEGGAFISAYDEVGAFIGDSWYPTREQALESASADHHGLGEWRPVPS